MQEFLTEENLKEEKLLDKIEEKQQKEEKNYTAKTEELSETLEEKEQESVIKELNQKENIESENITQEDKKQEDSKQENMEQKDITQENIEQKNTIQENIKEDIKAETLQQEKIEQNKTEEFKEQKEESKVKQSEIQEPFFEQGQVLMQEISVQDTKELSCDIKYNQLLDSIYELSNKIESMNTLFLKKIQHTECEEKILDQMHAELGKYKEDLYSQLVRPILLDIIEVRDSITRMTAIYKNKPEGEQDIPNKLFSDFAYDIQDILERQEVELYNSLTGDEFQPGKQRAIKRVPTTQADLHGKIAESMSSGYIYRQRILSPEKVSIYYFQENKTL